MTDQDQLEELLNRWEDLYDQGQMVSEEEICRTCPQLLAEFRRRVVELRQINHFLNGNLPREQEELTAAGRYRPLQLHAHGGLGEVFVARDDELGREVALKRMRSLDAVNPQRARLFQFEAEITGRLDHPGVVPIYGLGHDASGRLYYAMRFIHGETLQQAIEQFHGNHQAGKEPGARAIAFQKLIRSFLAVCQTIGYAHSQGVIHRDLKPANIMLGHYGETLVVDWGLAKHLSKQVASVSETLDMAVAVVTEVTSQTMHGQIKGSPAYMSPEQAEGRVDQIGSHSDIYGLGATLYAILAGKSPFADMELYKLLERVKRGDFPRPSQIHGDISPALEAICLKAMSLKQSDRYATALELAADLEHWLADDPVSAWREPLRSRAMRWVRKHQTLTSTIGAVVLVALLGISAVAVQQRKSNRALGDKNLQLGVAYKEKSDALDTVERLKEKAEEAEKQARRDLYNFLILAADRALAGGDRSFAEETLDKCAENLRNVEWRLLYRRAMGSERTWRIPQAKIPSVARNSAGTRIAIADLNGPVQIFDVSRGSVVAKIAGPARRVAFLPTADDNQLLVQAVQTQEFRLHNGTGDGVQLDLPGGLLELWSIKSRNRVTAFSPNCERFALSGDGKRIALVRVTWPDFKSAKPDVASWIEVCDVASGKRIALTGKIPGQVADAAFSPNHERLYAIVRQFDTKPGPFGLAMVSPGDASTRFQLQAWKVIDSPDPLHSLFSQDGPKDADAVAMAISPDGRQVFVADNGRCQVPGGSSVSRYTTGRITVMEATTGATVQADAYDLDVPEAIEAEIVRRPLDAASNLQAHVGSLAISPDGKRLAVANGRRIMVFERESRKRLEVFAGHLAAPQCVVFDCNGGRLWTAGGEDGRVKRWDLSHPLADRMVFPSGKATEGRGVALSGDSRLVAVATADGGIDIHEAASGRHLITAPPISSAIPEDKLSDAKYVWPPLKEPADKVHAAGYLASDIRFSPDGKRLTAVYRDRLLCVWDISGDKPRVLDFVDCYRTLIYGLSLEKRASFLTPHPHILLSPDGKYVASDCGSYRGQDQYYRVWEIADRRLVISQAWEGFSGRMIFSGNSRTFFLERSSPKASPSVLAWDLRTGKQIEVPGVVHLVDPVVDSDDQVSPDGTRRLRIVGGVLKIEDRQSGQTLLEYRGQDAFHWAIFSNDGNHILAAKSESAELLDASPIHF